MKRNAIKNAEAIILYQTSDNKKGHRSTVLSIVYFLSLTFFFFLISGSHDVCSMFNPHRRSFFQNIFLFYTELVNELRNNNGQKRNIVKILFSSC